MIVRFGLAIIEVNELSMDRSPKTWGILLANWWEGQYLRKPCLDLAGAEYAPLPEIKQDLG
jgi:hypothetical protein